MTLLELPFCDAMWVAHATKGNWRLRQIPNSHAYSDFFFFPRVSKGNNTHPRVSWASATPASSVPLYILCYPLQVVLELITYYKSYHGMTLCLAYNLPGSDLFSLGLRSALWRSNLKCVRRKLLYFFWQVLGILYTKQVFLWGIS